MIQNILLVDDRPENLLVLRSTLDQDDLNFIEADSGDTALRQLLRNDISLILLDVQMPGMDGFETAELIHGNPQTKHIPIIFISAINKEQRHIFKGYASGAVDYLFKPFEPEILRAKVRILLELEKQRRIMESQNTALQAAKKHTDNILKNVKEGLFLLDKNYMILPEYSRALEDILGEGGLAGVHLPGLVKKYITEDEFDALNDYLELCFRHDIDDSVVSDLNPFMDIIFNFPGNPGEKTVRYFSFDCRRIYNDEKISGLIFTVNDHTERVLLEKKLEKSEKQSKKQMEWFFSILHVDPKLLKEFVESTGQSITVMEEQLAGLTKKKRPEAVLEEMYRHMHQIKGNAAILNLKYFMEEAHQTEEIIHRLQQDNKIIKENALTLKTRFENFSAGIDEINRLIAKLSEIYEHFRPKRTFEIEMIVQSIKNLIANLCNSTGKDVGLVYENFDGVSIPYNCRLRLKDILVQLTRNAVSHGIESPLERKKAGKPQKGTIEVTTFKTDECCGFRFRDDGRGLQLKRLKDAASRSSKWKKAEIESWDDKQLQSLIFQTGITTTSQADMLAGRGIGMDIIQQMVREQGGSIDVDSEEGRYTEFLITFPSEN
jgi:CheY-like chemotaxis protein/signal transduction histidine kinase